MQNKNRIVTSCLAIGVLTVIFVLITGCFDDALAEQYIRITNQLPVRVRLVINGRESAYWKPYQSGTQQLFDIDNLSLNPERYVMAAYELIVSESFEQTWFEDGVRLRGHRGRLRFCRVYGRQELMSTRLVTVIDNVPLGATMPQTGGCPSVGG